MIPQAPIPLCLSMTSFGCQVLAATRFDDVWRQVWEEVRPLRRGADLVVHLGGQVHPTSGLSVEELAELAALEGENPGALTAVCRCPIMREVWAWWRRIDTICGLCVCVCVREGGGCGFVCVAAS
jgi:hypothetical protein